MGPFIYEAATNTIGGSYLDLGGAGMPVIAFNFITVEFPDANGLLVRRAIAATPEMYEKLIKLGFSAQQISHEMFPNVFGAKPRGIGAPVSAIEHLLGNEISPFLSASPATSQTLKSLGDHVYFDIATLKRMGVHIVTTEELAKSVDAYVAAHPHLESQARFAQRLHADNGEVLIKSNLVPKKAIYSEGKLKSLMYSHNLLRVVGVIGVAFCAYDVARASTHSVQIKSVRPIARELIRQAGGWGAARAGFAIGGTLGAAMGVETGPGLALTGLVGGMIFAIGGYYGATWVADVTVSLEPAESR